MNENDRETIAAFLQDIRDRADDIERALEDDDTDTVNDMAAYIEGHAADVQDITTGKYWENN